MTERPTLDDVLAIHRRMLELDGGADGIRERGQLESALGRLSSGYYADPIEEAAALLESIVGNHPFVDGNKRTGVAACDVLLRLNGLRLIVETADAHGFLVGLLERGRFRYEELEPWLRGHVGPLP